MLQITANFCFFPAGVKYKDLLPSNLSYVSITEKNSTENRYADPLRNVTMHSNGKGMFQHAAKFAKEKYCLPSIFHNSFSNVKKSKISFSSEILTQRKSGFLIDFTSLK